MLGGSRDAEEGIVGFALLGTLGAAYGTHLQIVLKHRYVRFRHDYFFLVADASIGKSGVFSYLTPPLYQIQRDLRNRVEGANEDPPPPRPQVVISDATPEATLKAQYENGGAAAMVSPKTPLDDHAPAAPPRQERKACALASPIPQQIQASTWHA